MYTSLLFLHSWLRWLALGAVVLVLLRSFRRLATSAPWSRNDTAWANGAAHTVSAQAVLGILLYAVSPYIRGLLNNMGSVMQDKVSRLFVVEHAVIMILVVALAHIGAARARKAPLGKTAHTRAAIFFGIALLLMGYAIPWMRPFFRAGL